MLSLAMREAREHKGFIMNNLIDYFYTKTPECDKKFKVMLIEKLH